MIEWVSILMAGVSMNLLSAVLPNDFVRLR